MFVRTTGRQEWCSCQRWSGTGVKTTLLQAWAMRKAVVSTPESAHGVPAQPGVNLLIGRTTPELVAHSAGLVVSPERCEALSSEGRKTAEDELDVRIMAAKSHLS